MIFRAFPALEISRAYAWEICRKDPEPFEGFTVRACDWRKAHTEVAWVWEAYRITYTGVPRRTPPRGALVPPGYAWNTWVDYRQATCCGWESMS